MLLWWISCILVRSMDVKNTPMVSFVSPEAIRGFSVHKEATSVTVVMISEDGSLYICHWITTDGYISYNILVNIYHRVGLLSTCAYKMQGSIVRLHYACA